MEVHTPNPSWSLATTPRDWTRWTN
jgi:hypothetical protein